MFSHTQSSLFPVRHQYSRRTFEYWLHEHLCVSIHNHGRPDVNLHDLRDTHQRYIYANISVASLLGFYLLIVQLFEAMGFPFYLPVGDLAKLWVRGLNKCEQRDVEESAAVGDS